MGSGVSRAHCAENYYETSIGRRRPSFPACDWSAAVGTRKRKSQQLARPTSVPERSKLPPPRLSKRVVEVAPRARAQVARVVRAEKVRHRAVPHVQRAPVVLRHVIKPISRTSEGEGQEGVNTGTQPATGSRVISRVTMLVRYAHWR